MTKYNNGSPLKFSILDQVCCCKKTNKEKFLKKWNQEFKPHVKVWVFLQNQHTHFSYVGYPIKQFKFQVLKTHTQLFSVVIFQWL